MKTVWKYEISSEDNFYLDLPLGAEVLSVQDQGGVPQMWCLVNPKEAILEQRNFRLAGTGHPITENNLKFIGTFQLYRGGFVGHLFEVL